MSEEVPESVKDLERLNRALRNLNKSDDYLLVKSFWQENLDNMRATIAGGVEDWDAYKYLLGSIAVMNWVVQTENVVQNHLDAVLEGVTDNE